MLLKKCAKKMKGKKTTVIHPFLFAVFPVFALYAQNMADTDIGG